MHLSGDFINAPDETVQAPACAALPSGRAAYALVGIILDGVQGVSPDTGVRQHSPDKADEILDRARRTLKDFESQKAQRGRTQRWMEHTTNELRRLIADAEAVRAGGPPKGVTHEAPTVAS